MLGRKGRGEVFCLFTSFIFSLFKSIEGYLVPVGCINRIMYKSTSNESANVEPSPSHLKWLHQLERVNSFQVGGEIVMHEIEVFGDYYEGDGEALDCVDMFLNDHSSQNLDIATFLLHDILKPLEYTLRVGVKEVTKDEAITHLRQQKATFIIKYVIPRIYCHSNFTETKDILSRSLTGTLVMIRDLYSFHPRSRDDMTKQATFFRVKEFLSNIVLQIWTVTLYEEGIALVKSQTIPYLRQLAMLDIFDKNWSYAGGWEQSLRLLEERFGDTPRISTDKSLNDNSAIIRKSRNSIRCQSLESANYPESVSFYLSDRKQSEHMYAYSPKCSAYLCSEIENPGKVHRLRCYKCNYYHWCSSACMDFTEEATDYHNKFCQACPPEKAEQCRTEMKEYLNIFDATEENEEMIKCHGCGLLKQFSRSMSRCTICKVVHYCSTACQTWDWNQGNHRLKCESPL
jgi:hypothetical protein